MTESPEPPNTTLLMYTGTAGFPRSLTTTSIITDGQDAVTISLGRRSTWEIVVWSIVLTLILVTAILGNLLVIACVRTTSRLRLEKSNMFLVNLSVTDVGSACVVMTSSLHAMAADHWHLGSVWCDLVCGANYAFIIVSMLTLCFISLDRYAAVVYALRYHGWVTRRKIRLLLAWAWFQGFCFGLAPVLAQWVRYDYWENVCAIVWHEDTTNTLTYVIVAFAVCFLMPGLILAVAYCKIIKVAKGQNNVHPHNALAQQDTSRIRPDMATSAGVTTDYPGISIISDTHNQVVAYHDDRTPQHDHTHTSQLAGSAARLENVGLDCLNHQCTSPELQQNLLARNREGCESGGLDQTLSASGDNEFSELQKCSDAGLMQYQESAVPPFKISLSFGKPPLKLKLNHTKAGYPENLATEYGLNGFSKFKSFSTPVSPSVFEIGFKTNLIQSKSEIFDQTQDSGQGQPATSRSRITLSQSDRPYSAPCQGSWSRDMGKTNASFKPTAFSQSVVDSGTSGITSERVEAWCGDHQQESNRQPHALNVQGKQETPLSLSDRPTHPTATNALENPNQSSLRPHTNSSCSFSEIPGSPPGEIPNGRRGTVSSSAPSHRNQNRQRNYSTSRKAVKSLLIVVLAFFICMTPFSITKLYKVIFPKPDALPGYVNLVATIFQYCSSVINPLIYGIFRRDFQKAFLLIFKKLLVKLRLRDPLDVNSDTGLLSL